jgi:hypothetical protein
MKSTRAAVGLVVALSSFVACAPDSSEETREPETSIGVTRSAVTVEGQTFLHAAGGALSMDSTVPVATTAAIKDSAAVKLTGGNPWVEVGTWAAVPSYSSGVLTSVGDAHLWLGLKNSDDIGTRFDVRAEIYKNGMLLASGETLCVQGITRNPDLAKDVTVALGPFSATVFDPTTDVLSFKVVTRIGTDGAGASCGGHGSATGLRSYFDAVSRPAAFGLCTPIMCVPRLTCATVERHYPNYPSLNPEIVSTITEPDVKVQRVDARTVYFLSNGLMTATMATSPLRFDNDIYTPYYHATIPWVEQGELTSLRGSVDANNIFTIVPFSRRIRPSHSFRYTVTCSGSTVILP